MITRRPLAPYVAAYFLVLVAGGIIRALGGSFSGTPVQVLMLVIIAAILATSAVILRRDPRAGLVWCGLVGAVCALVVAIYTLQADELDNSIGIGAFLLVGWPLMIIGAFAPRPVNRRLAQA